MNGNNELLFAYGTTNAGKTYTIHGTNYSLIYILQINNVIFYVGSSNDPGIIPRTLVLVFDSLNNKLMSQCKYKPDKVIAAHILDGQLMENEEEIRNNILNNWSNDKTQVIIKLLCVCVCACNNYNFFNYLRMNLSLVHIKLTKAKQSIVWNNLLLMAFQKCLIY